MQKINCPCSRAAGLYSWQPVLPVSGSTVGQTIFLPNPKFSHVRRGTPAGFREGDLVNEIKMLAVVSKILCMEGVEAAAISYCMRSRPCWRPGKAELLSIWVLVYLWWLSQNWDCVYSLLERDRAKPLRHMEDLAHELAFPCSRVVQPAGTSSCVSAWSKLGWLVPNAAVKTSVFT